uniref:Reverse transcriptase domain-containing protein n=1 Tax=Tanacetum cinerariifolium TaxID=118510 RepID=A0A6L2NPJ3_TANCI|nr:hypothetical protein [Tanacetum cinerariifolium]
MTPRSAGRETVEPRGGRTGERTGVQATEVNDGVDRFPDFSTIIAQQVQNLLSTILAQVGDQGSNLKDGRNQNGDAVNDNIWDDVRNVIENNDRRGCTYKEFLACNQKSMMETKLWNHAIVEAGHAAYTDTLHELARLVPHLVTLKNKRINRYVYDLALQIQGMVAVTKPTTIQKVVQIAGTLTDEAIRNGSIKKNPEKRGTGGEPSKDMNGGTITKELGLKMLLLKPQILLGERTQDCRVVPRNVNPVNARNEETTRGACFECRGTDYYKSACPRLNQAQGIRVNRPNQALAIDKDQGRGNNGIEPSDLVFSYEIEITSGKLVEIDKVIKGFKLEINGHVFDINLITFGSRSFDMIISIDWLSNHKAEIICHEKVVRIPLLDGKVLRILGERPEEKVRHLMSAKAKEQKQEEMVVELSGQLKELPDKGFIRPSSSP